MNGVFIPDYLLVKNLVDVSTSTIPSSIKYASTDLHERIHWFQHSATTWGNFCLIINQSITETFDNTAHYSNIKSVINDYHKIILDTHLYLKPDQNFKKESLLFKQNITDKFEARKFINFGSSNKNLDRCIEGLTYSRSDIFTEINYLQNENFECNLKELDELYQFKDCSIYCLNGEILQVKHLLECQARTNDTYYKLVSLQYGLDPKDLQILNSELYWMAFRHYLFFSGLNLEDVLDSKLHLETLKFNVIVVISLNPPIFPFYKDIKLQWDDFYPVQRFKQLCLCNKHFHNYEITNNDTYRNYENLLCKMLNWDTPYDISRTYVQNIDKRIIKFSNCWEKNSKSISNFKLYDYYQYLFYKFSELRIKSPSLISNFAFNSTEKDYIINIVELDTDQENTWFSCPMKMNKENDDLFTSIKDKQYSWLLIELLKSNIIKECILNKKILSKKSFPFIVKPGFKNYIIKVFREIYGIDLNDCWQDD